MSKRLVSYLQDNRDQILENWLTEADLPLPDSADDADGCHGTVPLSFLENAFAQVIHKLPGGSCNCDQKQQGLHLDDILNVTCNCTSRRFGGRVCIELHESGLRAFMSVFHDSWDTEGEFSGLDRKCCADLINHALSGTFGDEVSRCQHKHERSDCPFISK